MLLWSVVVCTGKLRIFILLNAKGNRKEPPKRVHATRLRAESRLLQLPVAHTSLMVPPKKVSTKNAGRMPIDVPHRKSRNLTVVRPMQKFIREKGKLSNRR
jgi:hypothetical protein